MATGDAAAPAPVRVGVLALQGSFREHMFLLQKVPGVEVVEVRTKEELESVAGLVIPGGESTTMALVAERWGLIPELQSFAKAGKPVWGTCAGMIFLAEAAEGEPLTWHRRSVTTAFLKHMQCCRWLRWRIALEPRKLWSTGATSTDLNSVGRLWVRPQARRREGSPCWEAWTSRSRGTSSGRRCGVLRAGEGGPWFGVQPCLLAGSAYSAVPTKQVGCPT